MVIQIMPLLSTIIKRKDQSLTQTNIILPCENNNNTPSNNINVTTINSLPTKLKLRKKIKTLNAAENKEK